MPAKYTRRYTKPEDQKVQKTVSLPESLLHEVEAMQRSMGLPFNSIAIAGIKAQVDAWKLERQG